MGFYALCAQVCERGKEGGPAVGRSPAAVAVARLEGLSPARAAKPL